MDLSNPTIGGIKNLENIEQIDNRINPSLIKILFFAFGEKLFELFL